MKWPACEKHILHLVDSLDCLTFIFCKQSSTDVPKTHLILGVSPFCWKATAISAHFCCSPDDSTHQRRYSGTSTNTKTCERNTSMYTHTGMHTWRQIIKEKKNLTVWIKIVINYLAMCDLWLGTKVLSKVKKMAFANVHLRQNQTLPH